MKKKRKNTPKKMIRSNAYVSTTMYIVTDTNDHCLT